MSSFINHRKMFVRVLFLCISNLKSKSIQSSKEYIVQFRYNVIKSALQYIFLFCLWEQRILYCNCPNVSQFDDNAAKHVVFVFLGFLRVADGHFGGLLGETGQLFTSLVHLRLRLKMCRYNYIFKKLFLNVICIELDIYRVG